MTLQYVWIMVYWNPEQLKEILKTNTMVVIPDNADAQRKKKKIQQKIRSGKRQEIFNNPRKLKAKKTPIQIQRQRRCI